MSSTFHQQQRRGFTSGSAKTYVCRTCKHNTRPTGTGDNDGVRLCAPCYDLAGEENSLSDTGTFFATPQQVLDTIAAVKGDASCWADLKAQAEQMLAVVEAPVVDLKDPKTGPSKEQLIKMAAAALEAAMAALDLLLEVEGIDQVVIQAVNGVQDAQDVVEKL